MISQAVTQDVYFVPQITARSNPNQKHAGFIVVSLYNQLLLLYPGKQGRETEDVLTCKEY